MQVIRHAIDGKQLMTLIAYYPADILVKLISPDLTDQGFTIFHRKYHMNINLGVGVGRKDEVLLQMKSDYGTRNRQQQRQRRKNQPLGFVGRTQVPQNVQGKKCCHQP